MSISRTTFLAYGVFALTCIAWGFVFWIGWRVWNAEDVIALQASNVEQVAAREASLMRLRSFVRETRLEREELRKRAANDIIQAVQVIEGAGKTAGILFEIGDAVSEEDNVKANIRTISLTVKARDTFARLTHAIALLETLPIPSKLFQFQLEKVPGTNEEWTLAARTHIVVLPGGGS